MNGLIWAVIAWTFVFSCLLTAVARRIAPRAGFIDRPDHDRKRHASATPLLGGLAIQLAVLTGVAGLTWIGAESFGPIDRVRFSPFPLLTSASLFCLVGLWDDRWGMRARTKFCWQIAASLPFALCGEMVESVQLLGWDIHFGSWGILLTIFWLVACANVINLVDGLDGLAGTVGIVVVFTVAALSALSGRFGVAFTSLAVAASLAGFLVHNWPPAKIFMGDSGSLTIGFIIGALSIEASLKQATGFAMIAPLVMISVPVFDTAMAVVRRKLTGKSIGHADRSHIHHRLQDRGMSRLQVLLFLTALCVVMAAASIASVYFHSDAIAIVSCVFVLTMLIIRRVFGYFESVLFLGHVREAGRLAADTWRALSTRMLIARLPHLIDAKPQDCWGQLCALATRKGVGRLDFACARPRTDEVLAQLTWNTEQAVAETGNVWEFQVTVQRERDIVATLRMAGEFEVHGASRRSNDLLLLADRFCRIWPIDQAEERPDTIPFPSAMGADEASDCREAANDRRNYRHAA